MNYGPPPQGYPPQGYGPPPGYYPPQPPPKKGLSGWAIFGIIVGVLFVSCVGVAMQAGKGASKAKAKADEDRKDPTSVDVEKLIKAYADNEIAADEKYKGQWLRVSGTVKSIDSSIGDRPVVRLGGDGFQSAMVNDLPKSDAAGLSKGQKLTVVCRCDGEIIGSPRLEDCEID